MPKRLIPTILAFSVLCSFAAAEPVTVTDAAGRQVTIADTLRIVAIGGTVTEILYALGVEDRVVAVDQTSTFPARAQEKPSIGYMRAVSPEGVLSLAPSLVVAIEDSGPRDAIEVLEGASVPFVLVPQAHDGPGVAATIRFVAEVIGEKEKGDAVAAAVLADIAAVDTMRARIAAKRKAVFVLGISGGVPTVAGSETSAADIFTLAGVDNALAAMTGYKPASDEAALAAAPEAIILMAERAEGITDATVFAAPAFAGTPAARNGRLFRMSGTYLLNFGPRTAHAARDLAAAIYPELALPALPERAWTRDAPSAATD